VGAARSDERLARPIIEEQVQKILRSAGFARCARMQRFLEYTVQETLSGRGHSLKEYSVALNVYDKPSSFDPRFDSIIRVEANRLRAKLKKYYETEGHSDAVQVSFPRNRYQPQFDSLGSRSGFSLRRTGVNFEARRSVLKGRHFLSQQAPRSIGMAMQCFSDALSVEPAYGVALAALGEAYASSVWMEYVSPSDGWTRVDLLARLALRHDPRLVEARALLACHAALYQWRWGAAEQQFLEILEADETCAPAHDWYGYFCLAPLGRLDEAEMELGRACELDPADAMARCHLGRVLDFKRLHSRAAEQFRRAIELSPRLAFAWWGLGEACVHMNAWNDARRAFAVTAQLADLPNALSGLAQLEAFQGHVAAAEQALERLEQLSSEHYISPLSSAVAEASLGRTHDAINRLCTSVEGRATRVAWLGVDPAFDVIKGDSRFLPLLDTIQQDAFSASSQPEARAS
jgi:tetratricopeptide (TPR) repeat protein